MIWYHTVISLLSYMISFDNRYDNIYAIISCYRFRWFLMSDNVVVNHTRLKACACETGIWPLNIMYLFKPKQTKIHKGPKQVWTLPGSLLLLYHCINGAMTENHGHGRALHTMIEPVKIMHDNWGVSRHWYHQARLWHERYDIIYIMYMHHIRYHSFSLSGFITRRVCSICSAKTFLRSTRHIAAYLVTATVIFFEIPLWSYQSCLERFPWAVQAVPRISNRVCPLLLPLDQSCISHRRAARWTSMISSPGSTIRSRQCREV